MKKTFLYFAVIFAAMFAGVSCEKIEQPKPQSPVDNSEIEEKGTYSVTFECSMAESEGDTKTEFHDNGDGTQGIWWSEGDVADFAQYAKVDGEYKYKRTYNNALTSSIKILSVTISSFNSPDDEQKAAYISWYPSSAFDGRTVLDDIEYPRLKLPNIQKPTAEQFDSDADILISEYKYGISAGTDGKRTVKLRYTRPSAIGKMTITNLNSSENIASIKISAQKSNNAVNLAGIHYYDLQKGEVSKIGESGSNVKNETELTLDYSEKEISANGMTAYFCCYPFELSEGDSFKLVITTTAGEVFTRTVEIPTERNLKFERGRGTQFKVDMSKVPSQYEASVTIDGNTTYHETINAALSATQSATSEATVKLRKSCKMVSSYDVNKNVTLDLNGFTLTQNATKRLGVTTGGTLTIEDTDPNRKGTITQTGTGYKLFYISAGELKIKGGKIIQVDNSDANVCDVFGNANLTISGGEIKGSGKAHAISFTSTGNLEISGGTIEGQSNSTDKKYAISMSGGTGTIGNGATIKNDYQVIVLSNSTLVINGGTVKSENSNAIAAASGSLDVNGGFFGCPTNYTPIYTSATGGATFSVKGGFYSNVKIATGFNDQNSYFYLETDMYDDYPYEVLPNLTFQQDGETIEHKATIEDAVVAANNAGGDCKITLNRDCTVGDESINITKTNIKVTLDLNGKTLTQNQSACLGVSGSGHLIITDNKGGGIVQQSMEAAEQHTISVTSGILTINGGTIKQGTVQKGFATINIDGAELNISQNAKIEGDQNNALCLVSGTVNISGGEISSSTGHAIYLNGGSNTLDLKITGGKIITTATSTSQYALYAYATASGSSIEINGGDFRSNDCVVYSAKANQAKIIVKKDGALSNAIPYFYTYKTHIFTRQQQVDDTNKTNSNVVSYGYFGASGQLTVNATATLTGCKKDDVDVTGPDNLKYTKYYHMD